jgi:hypothetical protein
VSLRVHHPVIENCASTPVLGAGLFACRSREESRTSYVGGTPQAAYDYWATRTKAGARHKETVGFKSEFVRAKR